MEKHRGTTANTIRATVEDPHHLKTQTTALTATYVCCIWVQVAVVGLCIVRLLCCACMPPMLVGEAHTAKQAASMHMLSGKLTSFGWTAKEKAFASDSRWQRGTGQVHL